MVVGHLQVYFSYSLLVSAMVQVEQFVVVIAILAEVHSKDVKLDKTLFHTKSLGFPPDSALTESNCLS